VRRFAAVMVLAASACTPFKQRFTCASDAQCVNGGASGVCELNAVCSFPDGSCPGSGRRYGAFAPPELANACVPPGGPMPDGGSMDGGGDAAPSCGLAGDPCCASGAACASPQLKCTSGVCTACVLAVAGGAAHTCALGAAGGVVCWGKNGNGQLGSGSTSDALTPTVVVDGAGAPLANITALTAGAAHTCALRSDGSVFCWGDDSDGQLGVGGSAAQNPQAAPAALTSVGALAAGAHHTCAALITSGLAYCWGRNDAGQLGAPPPTGNPSPAAVVMANGTQLDHVIALAAGATHTCARRSDGTLWCWGSNASGELGNGTMAPSASPVAVVTLGTAVAQVAAGAGFTCAALANGGVSCWGADGFGQSGQPAAAQVAVPTVVPSLGGVTALALGDAHACARRAGGGVSCWGHDLRGQLGAGDFQDRSAPFAVAAVPPLDAAFAGAGAAHTCAIQAGGLACWGADDSGQLGDGQHTDEKSPVAALLTCP